MLFSRVGVNEPVPTGKKEEQVNFCEYKQFMKDIKNEYPHLTISAQTQMAIERCAKLNEEGQSPRDHASSPPKFISGLGEVMARLRVSLASEASDIVDDRPLADGSCPTNDKKRTIQARPSGFALSVKDHKMLQELDCSNRSSVDDRESLAADSLTNSLADIETTSFMLEKQPQFRPHGRDVNNMSLRCIRRLSGLSALSDVDEIEELNDSDPYTTGDNKDDGVDVIKR